MTLTFNPRRATVVTHTTYMHTKTQVQKSVGSKVSVETNGRADGRADRRTDGCYRL